MMIEKAGVTSPLMFKDLSNGEPFYTNDSDSGKVFVKAYQFSGIGVCAVNLANGAVFVPKMDTPVTRSPAKVVLP